MIDGISERLLDTTAEHSHRPAYAASYRANSACARELTRLHDAVADGLAAWCGGTDEKPVVRRSPARCLVQVGPVALTLAWLQSGHGTVADGELLVVVWRGSVAVASRSPRGFERAGDRAGASCATSLWEQVYMVDASSEEAWGWAPVGGDALSSVALADQCVERLRAAYAEGSDAH
jgi:hypothetical protein